MQAEIVTGTIINNRYQVQQILGQGGFGRSYLALDLQRFGDRCVLKEFAPTSRQDYVLEKSRELFEREAKVLYQIQHPQIPQFLAWFAEGDRLFLVQEFIDGKTYAQLLRERQQQGQRFSEAEMIQWLIDLLNVLDYLHQLQIVHRDISPENIMLPTHRNQPVLIDFGLVKHLINRIEGNTHISVSQPASVVGKVGYAPPEQIRMGQCYPCSDLYALAVTALVLLTGKEPNQLMDTSLEWQWRSETTVGDRLAQVLDQMLADKPKDRYQSAQEVLAVLQSAPAPSQELLISIDKKPKTLPIGETDFLQNLEQRAHQMKGKTEETPAKKDLEINIDKARKERQVAEIIETDFFQNLERRASQLKDKNDPASNPSKTSPLDPNFLDHCRQELIRCIGPMGDYLLEETLAKNPQANPEQLRELLINQIPIPQRAQELKNRIQLPTAKSQTPANANSAFVSACQAALIRCVGPMGDYLLEEALSKQPQATAEEILDTLVSQIPSPQRAKEFKELLQPLVQPKTDKISSIDLQHLATQMRGNGGLEITNRRHHFKTHTKCFTGAGAVNWLTQTLKISPEEAVRLGQRLIDAKLIHHVTDDYPFRAENLFYRFYVDEV